MATRSVLITCDKGLRTDQRYAFGLKFGTKIQRLRFEERRTSRFADDKHPIKECMFLCKSPLTKRLDQPASPLLCRHVVFRNPSVFRVGRDIALDLIGWNLRGRNRGTISLP